MAALRLAPAGKRGTGNHHWTAEEQEIVRRDYDGTSGSAERIAERLEVTFCAVKGQVQKLGCAKITDRHRWNDKDDERLAELITKVPVHVAARRMGLSVNAVTVRAKRLGLSRRARDGWYTKREVCEIVGMDHKWVQRRIDRGELKARPHKPGERPQQNGGTSWHVEADDLREFIRGHCHELNGHSVDLVQIVELLAGLPLMGKAEA